MLSLMKAAAVVHTKCCSADILPVLSTNQPRNLMTLSFSYMTLHVHRKASSGSLAGHRSTHPCVWYSLIDCLQRLGVAIETSLLLVLVVVIGGSSENMLGAELHGILLGPPFILADNQGSVPQGIEPVTGEVLASLQACQQSACCVMCCIHTARCIKAGQPGSQPVLPGIGMHWIYACSIAAVF